MCGLPLLERQVLVPTKELCDQTYRALQELTYYCRDTITVQVSSTGPVEASL